MNLKERGFYVSLLISPLLPNFSIFQFLFNFSLLFSSPLDSTFLLSFFIFLLYFSFLISFTFFFHFSFFPPSHFHTLLLKFCPSLFAGLPGLQCGVEPQLSTLVFFLAFFIPSSSGSSPQKPSKENQTLASFPGYFGCLPLFPPAPVRMDDGQGTNFVSCR